MRENSDSEWETIIEKSVAFASKHNISAEFPDERLRRKKKMAGEKSHDERNSGIIRFKVETFIKVLDEVIQQFDSSFDKENVLFMRQLSLFTPSKLFVLGNYGAIVQIKDIKEICQRYEVDADEVAQELKDFAVIYRLLSTKNDNTESMSFAETQLSSTPCEFFNFLLNK